MDGRKGLWIALAIIFSGSLFFGSPSIIQPVMAAESAEPIKVGALVPLTGALLHEGPKVKIGIEMALEDAGWQAAGRKIELIVEDSATDPTTALSKVRKLVEKDKVIAIIGPQHSGVAKAIQPYMNKNKVLSMKSRQFPLPLIKQYPYLIVLDGTQKQVCSPMGWYAYEKLGYKKVNTMGPDYIAGRDFVGGFIAGFKEKGGEIALEQWFPVGNVDFAPYLAALKPADGTAAWVAGPGALRLITQYEEYGLSKRMPLMGAYASSLVNEDFLPQLGDKALGIIGPSSYASTIDNPVNKRVVANYKKKFKVPPPDSLMVGGYMNAFVLVEGLKASKGDASPETLRKTILGLKMQKTPIGPLSFTPDGAGIYNVYIVKVSKVDGEYVWQIVHTYPNTKPH